MVQTDAEKESAKKVLDAWNELGKKVHIDTDPDPPNLRQDAEPPDSPRRHESLPSDVEIYSQSLSADHPYAAFDMVALGLTPGMRLAGMNLDKVNKWQPLYQTFHPSFNGLRDFKSGEEHDEEGYQKIVRVWQEALRAEDSDVIRQLKARLRQQGLGFQENDSWHSLHGKVFCEKALSHPGQNRRLEVLLQARGVEVPDAQEDRLRALMHYENNVAIGRWRKVDWLSLPITSSSASQPSTSASNGKKRKRNDGDSDPDPMAERSDWRRGYHDALQDLSDNTPHKRWTEQGVKDACKRYAGNNPRTSAMDFVYYWDQYIPDINDLSSQLPLTKFSTHVDKESIGSYYWDRDPDAMPMKFIDVQRFIPSDFVRLESTSADPKAEPMFGAHFRGPGPQPLPLGWGETAPDLWTAFALWHYDTPPPVKPTERAREAEREVTLMWRSFANPNGYLHNNTDGGRTRLYNGLKTAAELAGAIVIHDSDDGSEENLNTSVNTMKQPKALHLHQLIADCYGIQVITFYDWGKYKDPQFCTYRGSLQPAKMAEQRQLFLLYDGEEEKYSLLLPEKPLARWNEKYKVAHKLSITNRYALSKEGDEFKATPIDLHSMIPDLNQLMPDPKAMVPPDDLQWRQGIDDFPRYPGFIPEKTAMARQNVNSVHVVREDDKDDDDDHTEE